jgi:hypothetical protein
VRTQGGRGLTTVNRIDRQLGLNKNLGRHKEGQRAECGTGRTGEKERGGRWEGGEVAAAAGDEKGVGVGLGLGGWFI